VSHSDCASDEKRYKQIRSIAVPGHVLGTSPLLDFFSVQHFKKFQMAEVILLVMHWHPAPKIPKRGGTCQGAQDSGSAPASRDLDPGSLLQVRIISGASRRGSAAAAAARQPLYDSDSDAGEPETRQLGRLDLSSITAQGHRPCS
jgi:hypothetical protein